jgi:hypothetical protein
VLLLPRRRMRYQSSHFGGLARTELFVLGRFFGNE